MELVGKFKIGNDIKIDEIKNVFLEDIQFYIPDREGYYIHLDFDEIDTSFKGNEVSLRMRTLAETHESLNIEEYGITNEDITIDRLKRGGVENYIVSIVKSDNSEHFDIELKELLYWDGQGYMPFELGEDCVNEADLVM